MNRFAKLLVLMFVLLTLTLSGCAAKQVSALSPADQADLVRLQQESEENRQALSLLLAHDEQLAHELVQLRTKVAELEASKNHPAPSNP